MEETFRDMNRKLNSGYDCSDCQSFETCEILSDGILICDEFIPKLPN